jgi:uncharacterized protein with PhoU and TrkA domain
MNIKGEVVEMPDHMKKLSLTIKALLIEAIMGRQVSPLEALAVISNLAGGLKAISLSTGDQLDLILHTIENNMDLGVKDVEMVRRRNQQ